MVTLEEIKSALERLETNTETDTDRQILAQAVREKMITIESGERSVSAGGHIGNSIVVTGNGNVIQVIKPSTAEALKFAIKSEIIDITGQWSTQELINPFSKHDKFRFLFDFEVKGDVLLGAVRQVSTENSYDFTKGILEGKINGNIISFHTKEQSLSGDKEYTYINCYYGSVSKNEVEFTLQSDRPWGFPPQKFTAKRE